MEDWRSRVRKGDMVLVPLRAGGHWTLLVLEKENYPRVGPVCPEPEAALADSGKEVQGQEAVYGCGCCDHAPSGCAFCNPAKGRRKEARKDCEKAMLELERWPELPTSDYKVRYYDSLKVPSGRCLGQLEAVLALLAPLGVPTALPPRRNQRFQEDSWECGLWLCIFAEEECGRYRGEALVRARITAQELEFRRGRINALLAICRRP